MSALDISTGVMPGQGLVHAVQTLKNPQLDTVPPRIGEVLVLVRWICAHSRTAMRLAGLMNLHIGSSPLMVQSLHPGRTGSADVPGDLTPYCFTRPGIECTASPMNRGHDALGNLQDDTPHGQRGLRFTQQANCGSSV